MSFDTLPHQRRALMAINGHALAAATFAGLAWWLWPTRPEWWGLGVMSALFALQAVISLAAAAKALFGYLARARAVAAFAAQGGPVRSAAMASHRALVDAGMVDDHA